MSSRGARLVLSDGSLFRGRAFGGPDDRAGEVVFNTSMTGYQEIATDPSYAGQVVCMTYPHIGNYGVNPDDHEAPRPWIEGMVVRELSPVASNFRSRESLEDWFARTGVLGIEGVDTRRLTRRLRLDGAVNGVLCADESASDEALIERARALPSMAGQDLVQRVTCSEPYDWTEGWDGAFLPTASVEGARHAIVVMDFGVKRNILRSMVAHGLDPYVVPATTPADAILARNAAGVFLSNGPGDPAAVTYAVDTIRDLLGKVPMFGICLGHQLMALAGGATTYKLKFGHRGANHPVQDHATRKIEITSQNHGFVVDAESLASTDFEPTHTNLNDMTNAGISSSVLRAFGVQYHPEAAPGPHDAQYLFSRFRALIEGAPMAGAPA